MSVNICTKNMQHVEPSINPSLQYGRLLVHARLSNQIFHTKFYLLPPPYELPYDHIPDPGLLHGTNSQYILPILYQREVFLLTVCIMFRLVSTSSLFIAVSSCDAVS